MLGSRWPKRWRNHQSIPGCLKGGVLYSVFGPRTVRPRAGCLVSTAVPATRKDGYALFRADIGLVGPEPLVEQLAPFSVVWMRPVYALFAAVKRSAFVGPLEQRTFDVEDVLEAPPP